MSKLTFHCSDYGNRWVKEAEVLCFECGRTHQQFAYDENNKEVIFCRHCGKTFYYEWSKKNHG